MAVQKEGLFENDYLQVSQCDYYSGESSSVKPKGKQVKLDLIYYYFPNQAQSKVQTRS